jgi:hypothetical protein
VVTNTVGVGVKPDECIDAEDTPILNVAHFDPVKTPVKGH